MLKVKVNKEFSFEVESHDDEITFDGKKIGLDIKKISQNNFHVLYKYKSYNVELLSIDNNNKLLKVSVNGTIYEIEIKDRYDILLEQMGLNCTGNSKENEIKAPMPGLVLDLIVKEGESVSKGDGVLILEAMKMENILKAPSDCVIKKIRVKKNEKVDKNQVLITLT